MIYKKRYLVLAFILLCILGVILPNNILRMRHTNEEISLCIFVFVAPVLAKDLERINKEIAVVDQNQAPIENVFHISLRQIKHHFTQQQIKELAEKVANIASATPRFFYRTGRRMYIDSDKDIGLNLTMDKQFNDLQDAVSKIKLPGDSKSYQPHTTVYYAVKHSKAVQDYMNRMLLDTNKNIPATSIGIGILGPRNNLAKILYRYDLQ